MTPPANIGHYRIGVKLGEGGMGAVYRATDTKLGRDVAVKILPDAVARDPERLARFGREAKTLAALNHPHIAQIYGVEDRALVMELVEGATLRGPLPIATALTYAKQIAEALEAAQDKGIIHRDLKPANIMVTSADGEVHGRARPLLRFGKLPHLHAGRHARRSDHGHRRLYEPGAGARRRRGPACRHLVFRGGALRTADREARVRERIHFRHAGGGAEVGPGLGRASRGHSRANRAAHQALPDA